MGQMTAEVGCGQSAAATAAVEAARQHAARDPRRKEEISNLFRLAGNSYKENTMRYRSLQWLIPIAFTTLTLCAQQHPVSERAVQRIQKEVRHELVMLPFLTVFDNLEFKVEGTKVTLLGQVVNPVNKTDAERAVKGIEGVEQVENQIEVLPVSPNDDRLRMALYRAIYGYGPLEKYDMGAILPIRIIVKNGHATLEGVVDSQSDKDMAGIRAKGVPGVFSVANNLQVMKG
jgi:hyperosmotically inducible protein